MRLTEEWCPKCDSESIITMNFRVQTCSECGEDILPCSLCEDENCLECPLKQ